MSYDLHVAVSGENTETNQAAGAIITEALITAGFGNTSLSHEGSNEPVVTNSASALDVLRATHPAAFAEANISVTAFNGVGEIGGGSGDISQEEKIGSSLADAEAQSLGEKMAEVA